MPPLSNRPVRSRQRGFTIVEVVLVVTILAVLTTVAYASYQDYQARIQLGEAVAAIGNISALVEQYRVDRGTLPAGLADVGAAAYRDPWGNAYQYASHADNSTRGQWRKDHNIVPINSDFDLWSMGKDGSSAPALTAKPSRDDVVRANNGRFIGLASQYDP